MTTRYLLTLRVGGNGHGVLARRYATARSRRSRRGPPSSPKAPAVSRRRASSRCCPRARGARARSSARSTSRTEAVESARVVAARQVFEAPALIQRACSLCCSDTEASLVHEDLALAHAVIEVTGAYGYSPFLEIAQAPPRE